MGKAVSRRSGPPTRKTPANQDLGELRNTVLLRSAAPAPNVFEATVERLGQSIKLGLFMPGQQLPPERELAEITGVSRVTVRSAIQVLIAGGFLRARRGRNGGTFVVDDPPLWPAAEGGRRISDIKAAFDLLDQRHVIGSGVAMLAAQRIGKPQVANLREMVGRLGELVDRLADFRAVDAQLHIAIAEATGNERLVRQTAEIEAELSSLIQMIPRSGDALLHSNQQHARIVGCLAARDADGARIAMGEHLDGTKQLLTGLLPVEGGKVK
jgi:DNA-binding FadR family transcriptional regulator